MTTRQLSLLVVLVLLGSSSVSFAGGIEPGLESQLNALDPESKITVLVHLTEQAPIEELSRDLTRARATRAQRHETIVRALTEAASSQRELLDWCDRSLRSGSLDGYTSYWIINAVVVRGTPDAIWRIASREDVSYIERNPKVRLITPVGSRSPRGGLRGIGVTPGLRAIQADRVWNELGITGRGVLVANLDTGVDGYHPALIDRWRGNRGHPWWECWLDVLGEDTTYPEAGSQHGTHVMGTITGLGVETGDTVGVAWGSEWIACNAIDQTIGEELDNDILNAFQWFADPDGNPATDEDVPDVCQNSWGVEGFGQYEECDTRWSEVIDNCEAAGCVLTFSAGNSGPDSLTVGSPGDRCTTPYNCFSVGAVDATNFDWPYPIADFSSRGPSECPEGEIKPEVAAPGVEVYSSIPGGDYAQAGWDGTSMAGPHVAGIVALMLEANPDLESDVIKQIIMDTSRDEGDPGEDNTYGWGFPDAYAAVTIALQGTGTLAGSVTNTTNGGSPVEDVRILLRDSAASYPTDAAGDYLGHAIAGTYTAVADHPSFAPDSFEVVIDLGTMTIQDFALIDIAGPAIADVSDPRTIPGEVGPYPILATIVDQSEIVDARVIYRVNAGDWVGTPMDGVGDTYTGEIPGQLAGSRVDFYIQATDVGSNVGTFPENAPDEYTTFLVTLPVLVDDAETNQGWFLGWPGDTATGGIWVREDPVGTMVGARPGQPEDDHTPDPGHICFVTGNANPGDPPGTNDVDGGCTTLVSPTFDLSEAVEAYLYYWRWFGQFGLYGDTFTVQVTNNNGLSWTDIELLDYLANEWTEVAVRLDQFIEPTASMRLRFIICDIGLDSTIEGTVDDVSIEAFPMLAESVADADIGRRAFLAPAQPNPAQSSARIAFQLATPGHATLTIFDAEGRQVRQLFDGQRSAGIHEVVWDGRNDSGQPVGTGVYFYRLRADRFEQSSRVSLIR